MKLVKSTKIVKLPQATSKVHGTLKRAMREAQEKGWDKVIIIGQGKDDSGSWRHSSMSDLVALGMLEKVKHSMLTDD